MLIRDQMATDGNWLFRWRSYIPVCLAPLLAIAIWNFSYPGGSHRYDIYLEIVCFAIAATGLGIRAHAIGYAAPGTSGGNTRKQVAESLNTSGMYSVVRHPLYLGNAIMWFSVFLYGHIFWIIAVVAMFFALYYERIMLAEERFLEQKFGDEYRIWASATPAFVPNLWLWKPPSRSFDWLSVVRRDYGAVMALVTLFTLIEVGGDVMVEGHFELEPFWGVLFFGTGAFYLLILVLKRRTRLLR